MKVCLIGNNLTSLILAYILSKKNFDSEIYYIKSSKSKFKTRTLGITDHNLEYLNKYFKNIYKKTHPINRIEVLIKNKKINEKVLFNDGDNNLFNMVKYEDIFMFIKSKLHKKKNISFKILKNKSKLLKLVNQNKFKLVVNCENRNILTSKYLQNRIFKNYKNKAYTTIIHHKSIKNNKAVQVFTEYGPIAFLPLSNKKTSIVYSVELKYEEILSENKILKLLKNYNPYYKITSIENLENFNLNLALPKNYYYNNILFFGDSLHKIHPLAGQGFNMTLRDISKFDSIIESKLNLGLNIDKSIYQEFEKISKNYNSMFSFGIDFIYEFFKFNRDFVPKNISEGLFKLVHGNRKIKELAIRFANQGK